LHGEMEERRAQRAPFLHANVTWYFHRLAVQIEGHLQVRVHTLDDVNEVSWNSHLG